MQEQTKVPKAYRGVALGVLCSGRREIEGHPPPNLTIRYYTIK